MVLCNKYIEMTNDYAVLSKMKEELEDEEEEEDKEGEKEEEEEKVLDWDDDEE